MRAVKMWGRGQVTLESFPDPTPGDGEVLVQVKISALCGSELHGYRGEQELAANGGHEAVGVVVDASRSAGWQPGDRVGLHAVWGCGECHHCQQGQYTYCSRIRACGPAHAELLVAPAHTLLALPDEMSWEAGVLLTGDGMGVPMHVSRRLSLPEGAAVAVFGAGPIGLGNVLLQHFLQRWVIAVDVNPYRLELAHSLGAATTINARDADPVEAVRALTSGEGADACLECAGLPETLRLAMRSVRKGGTVAAVGENREVTFHIGSEFIRPDLTLFGSWYYHLREYPLLLDLHRQGLQVERLITHRFPASQADEAYRCFAAGETGKTVLRW